MPADRFYIGTPYQTGLQTDIKPFALPEDAFAKLQNAYVWRGRVTKRFGGQYMTQDVDSDLQQFRSRLRINLGTTNGAGVLAGTVPGTVFKVGQAFSIGSVIYTVITAGVAQTMLQTTATATATYSTTNGAYSFAGAPATTDVYFYPGEPVMGFITYEVPAINDEPVYAFDTQFAYEFINDGWERRTGGSDTWTGDNADFFWGATWRSDSAADAIMFVTNFNSPDRIRYFDGSTFTILSAPTLTGVNDEILTARIIIPFANRLVLLNTIETVGGVTTSFVNRARYSQFGSPVESDAWREDIPGKGGSEDAPTKEAIITAQIFRNRLIVYLESSTWELVSTGNEVRPFVWQNINIELGAESNFSVVAFDKAIVGIAENGIHVCNGASVERIDEKIPDSVWTIDNDNSGVFRVAGIRDYWKELVYWTFPSANGRTTGVNDVYPSRVICYNYKNDSWAFFDDSITMFGYFQLPDSDTWRSNTNQWRWEEKTWGDGEFQKLFQAIVAGNQEGYTFIVNPELPRNAGVLQITNMSESSGVVTLTIVDHNLEPGTDYILIEYAEGVTGINDAIYPINDDDTATVNTININVPSFAGTYTGKGVVSRVSRIDILTKQFNFYAKEGRSLALNKVDFLVDRVSRTVVDEETVDTGQITIGVLPSTAPQGVPGAQELTLTLNPYTSRPYEEYTDQYWHSVYPSGQGEYIQFNVLYGPNEIQNIYYALSPFVLHGMIISANRTNQFI